MRRLFIAAMLAGSLMLSGCTTMPDYTEAHIAWYLGALTDKPHRITWTVSLADGTVERVEDLAGQVTQTSYQLADGDEFREALHAALNPPQQPRCPDANGVTVQANSAGSEKFAAAIEQCGRQDKVADALLDAVEEAA